MHLPVTAVPGSRSACLAFLAAILLLTLVRAASAEPVAVAAYVGTKACGECHAEQVQKWTGSHHDVAMQEVSEKTVLGNFGDVSFTHYGVTSTFYRVGERFMVRTEGATGELENFEIRYVFGVYPLQQYLIEFPGGRLQALGLAWDTRPKGEGGQRWFHLYPDEKIAYDDELHWTRPSQNWNSMCAECHSTNLQKNYDPATKTFATTSSEIDVACEACHGPGSNHVLWAENKSGWEKFGSDQGLALSLDERKGVSWTMDSETENAMRSTPRKSEKEIEMCARCHARRGPITDRYVHGDRFMDHYMPRRLDEGMYFADGQIDDEVYVYGSFLQSRMYQAGVTCSDCHEPHDLGLRALGNAVCLQCHQADRFDAIEHHRHAPGSVGASCAECHMPPRKYMVVDPRHDHSMRIPRPDLSVQLGTPNACNNCHRDKSPQWSADQVKAWYGDTPGGIQRYAQVLQDARGRQPGAGHALAALVRETHTPNIARATALAAIGPHLDRDNADVLQAGLTDRDPMVRAASVSVLESVPLTLRVRLAWPLLRDPVRAVRIEAARLLAAVPTGELADNRRRLLERAVAEYRDSQLAMAERPEAQMNLGNLHAARGDREKATAAYREAIALDVRFAPAYINLAELYRNLGDESGAEQVLREGIAVIGSSADLHHVLGLALVRQERLPEALGELEQAARLNSENPRYVYVYAVGLNTAGRTKEALMVLQGAHNAHPVNTDILSALVAFHRDAGNHTQAQSYAQKLQALAP